jgi:hypothetical protein
MATTSTSSGNRTDTTALPISLDSSTAGPVILPEAGYRKNMVVRYSNSDKYMRAAGLLPLTYLGTANTNWKAKEYGSNSGRLTILECTTAFSVTVASGAGNLSVGTLLYTFPAVDVVVGNGSRISAPTGILASVTPLGTPDIGLGSTQGTGAVGTIPATGQNVLTAVTLTDANSSAFNLVDNDSVAIAGTSNPKLYLNFADTWAASDTLTIPVGFKVMFHWRPLADIEQDGYHIV